MAEDKKPKTSSLDDILKTAGHYALTERVAGAQTYAEDLNLFRSYLQSSGRDPSHFPGLEKNPELFSDLANEARKQERKNLASQTEKALSEVLGKVDEDLIVHLSLEVANSDKDYSFYKGAFEAKDAEAIRNEYVKRYGKTKDGKEDVLYMGYAKKAGAEELFHFARIQLGQIRKKFVEKNLSSEKTEKGAKQMQYDPKKAQDYFVKSIANLKPEQKEEVLVKLGSFYAQQRATEEAEKAKAKK